MNPLYILDHFIFSVFMTLILIEGGFAVTALLAYGKYKERLMRYITPIWEVTGTFAVFYAVNFEATFPKLLGAAGTIYAVPLLVAAALIIIRNAFLIHAEYLGDIKREAKYLKVYAIATIAALVILMSVLSSAMTGAGISLASSSASLSMYINPFNLIVVACSILMALSLAAGIFHIERIGKFAWLPLALAVMLFYAGIYLYVPAVAAVLPSAAPVSGVLAVLIAALAVAQSRNWRYSGMLSVVVVLFALNFLGVVQYPYILGSVNITDYLNSSALSGPIIAITLIGGAIVAASLSYLVYLSYLRKEKE